MKNKINSGNRILFLKNNFDYFMIAGVYFVLHMFMHTDYWDDLRNAGTFAEFDYSMIKYAIHTFFYVASRVMIQPVLVAFSGIPNIFWKLCDVVMILLLYHYLVRTVEMLCPKNNKTDRVWCFLFFLCFPYSLMATAGWIATTVTYTWTFAAFFYCMYILIKTAKEGQCTIWQYILYGIAVFWTGNFNVTSISLLLLLPIIYLLYDKNKASRNLFFEGMLLSATNLILFMTAPGNRIRNVQDAEFHGTAELLELNIFGKLRMGINATFYHFMSVPNAVLFTGCLILAICVWKKGGKLWQKIIGVIPLCVDVIWTCYMFFAYIIRNGVLTYTYPDAGFETCPKVEQYLAMISAIFMVAGICYTLAFLTDFSRLSTVLISIVLLVGLLPQVALGFTTTVTASCIRMSTFFYFSLMLCTYVLVRYCKILENKFWKMAIYAVISVGTVLNVMQVVRHIIVYG